MNRFNKYKLSIYQNGRYPHFEYYQNLEQCYKEVSSFINDISIVYKDSGYIKKGNIRKDKTVYFEHQVFGIDTSIQIDFN